MADGNLADGDSMRLGAKGITFDEIVVFFSAADVEKIRMKGVIPGRQ
jgi:hypothetical protein